MIHKRFGTCPVRNAGYAVLFYLLLLQNPLESRIPVMKLVDEALALVGVAMVLYQVLKEGRLRLKGSTIAMVVAFAGFLLAGLLGNLLWQYQPLKAVVTDLYTNMKFFLAVISGAQLFRRERGSLSAHARFAAVFFFLLLLADQLFHLFPSGETRYGLRVSRLIYTHPTYLAGAMVFLLAVLTAGYEKKNKTGIAMCLAVLLFTLRGKAIAGAMVYGMIAYFLLHKKKKLRLGHLLLMALAVLAVAGRQVSYYYLELRGRSARSVLTQTAFRILGDYFPIGTGFGTYGSHVAANPYSPVYVRYDFREIYELGGGGTGFFDDTFWPIILGQTGLLGSLCYVVLLGLLFWRIQQVRKCSFSAYAAGIFAFVYLMISATSEPAFNNSVSVPLAMMLGQIITQKEECTL